MNKSDLRTGMKVILRDGGEYIVLLGVEHSYSQEQDKDIFIGRKSQMWDSFDQYKDDLSHIDDRRDDIVKVYMPMHPFDIFFEHAGWELIWERDDRKPMTLEQIEKELGYKIKLIS